MKKWTALVLALALFAIPGVAGDSCVEGSDCENCCPLAKQANQRMATGTEAMFVASSVAPTSSCTTSCRT